MTSVLRLTLVLVALAAFGTGHAQAPGTCRDGGCWVDGLTPTTIAVDDNAVKFAVSPQPLGTCNYYGYLFKFDHKTETGKAFLNMLTAAKLANRQLILWYRQSTATGDCTAQINAMAVVTGVGMR